MTIARVRRQSCSPRSHRAPQCLLAALSVLLAFPGEIRDQPMEVAALQLACRPIAHGASCRLLALFHNATQPPRDVTGWASWRVAGAVDLHLSAVGAMEASGMGDIVLDTSYQSHAVRMSVRLIPHGPAQLLATVRGAVYVAGRGRLTPAANAQLEVMSGPSHEGGHTTTRDDGTYELVALAPGRAVIHAMKSGFVDTDLSIEILPGVNRVSVVLFAEVPNGTLAL
jgi:hypothetical protein